MEEQWPDMEANYEDPAPIADVLMQILKQLSMMNSKIEGNAESTSNVAPSVPGNIPSYGRVPVVQENNAEVKTPFRKGDLPNFSGDQAQGWLNWVERFFHVHILTDAEKLNLISLHLVGAAQAWFIYAEKQFCFKNWSDFRRQFERLYGFSSKSLRQNLFNLQQTGDVSDCAEFKLLVAYLLPMDPDVLETAYLNGLKPEIGSEVPKYRPFGIQQVMDVSIEAETDLKAMWQTWLTGQTDTAGAPARDTRPKPVQTTVLTLPYSNFRNRSGGIPLLHKAQSPSVERPTENLSRPPRKKIMRLTDEEFQPRREKGLCYHCNDKYLPGHRCKRELNIFLVHEGHSVDEIPINEEDLMQTDDTPIFEGSLCAVRLAPSNNGSMKVWGELLGRPLVILIDRRASHNRIHMRVVGDFNIPIEGTMRFDLILGDGSIRKATGLCIDVPITIQGLSFYQDLIPFDLGDIDLILGIQWMKTLGWFHATMIS
ncbi:uncharacterized protein LOC144707710 [Wolffia australiana]